jgi:hypothetical protein
MVIVLQFLAAEEQTMVAKNPPENDPHDTDFLEDLTERVFKDYEPPRQNDSLDKSEEEETDGDESHRAA